MVKSAETGLDHGVETGGPPTWRVSGFRARIFTRLSRSSLIGPE